MTRIYIVDDHPIMLEMLRALLEREPDLTVCGEARAAVPAFEDIEQRRPDLVLVDVALPDRSGIKLARQLRERFPDLHLIMLSGHGERTHVDGALEAGANGYVLKGRTEEIPEAVRHVLGGGVYLSEGLRR